ncbi:MAG: acyl-CoA thioesterase [Acidobacteriaceae bacterium]|nr:acyl-CoA thioesterase [Acidobacteriaceae bacterium]MBV8572761.1 acyl-CoA thioesterase [Acidobacteriaceae bacterium]
MKTSIHQYRDRPPEHETRLRVRYAETDQMGVVYHANYLVWMEIGRVELVRARGFNYKELEQTAGLYLAVMEANCRYLFPARYDEEIVVQTSIVKSNLRMVEFAYRIVSVDPKRVLAEGLTKHVWLNREFRPTRLPEAFYGLLQPD